MSSFLVAKVSLTRKLAASREAFVEQAAQCHVLFQNHSKFPFKFRCLKGEAITHPPFVINKAFVMRYRDRITSAWVGL